MPSPSSISHTQTSSCEVPIIPVTEPFLPPLDEYVEYLKGIWERKWLTNHGPLVKELEQALQDYHHLDTPVQTFANGGLALQTLLKAMGIKGEIITTPFSYVATVSCPLWEGCTIKFSDIDPDHLTLDPTAAEAAITSRTEAILATHVYGNPCDVEAFERIGQKHGIPILYDAAHAFGVTYKGRSLLEWGDASMVSLHATKVFHTIEGGMAVARNPAVREKLGWMKRFGHHGFADFHGVAINAKMSEFHAAMGLVNLNYIDANIQRRLEIVNMYQTALADHTNIRFAFTLRPGTQWNAAYCPVLFNSEASLLHAEQKLKENHIQSRRYFHPTLNRFEFTGAKPDSLPVSKEISEQVLCLPVSPNTNQHEVDNVVEILHV